MRVVLYQPDIAGNLGAAMRTCACLGVPLEVIEPCGFPLTAKALRRTAMDYGAPDTLLRHKSWNAFAESNQGRIVLLTTKGATPVQDFAFETNDTLLFGRESAGVPDDVHAIADGRVIIPMAKGVRSYNLANSVSITLFEALRQTKALPL